LIVYFWVGDGGNERVLGVDDDTYVKGLATQGTALRRGECNNAHSRMTEVWRQGRIIRPLPISRPLGHGGLFKKSKLGIR
jgi:hypothetical protein